MLHHKTPLIFTLLGHTYTEDRRVVGHCSRLRLLFRRLDDGELLHIAAAEDNIFVVLIGAGDLFGRVLLAAFGAVRLDVLEGDSGGFAVDLVEGAHVSARKGSVLVE